MQIIPGGGQGLRCRFGGLGDAGQHRVVRGIGPLAVVSAGRGVTAVIRRQQPQFGGGRLAAEREASGVVATNNLYAPHVIISISGFWGECRGSRVVHSVYNMPYGILVVKVILRFFLAGLIPLDRRGEPRQVREPRRRSDGDALVIAGRTRTAKYEIERFR